MRRAIALSLFLLIGTAAVVPFVTEYAEASAYKRGGHKRKLRKYKKYSKNWWRQYYRRQQRNNSLIAQRRAVRLRQIRLANALNGSPENAGKRSALTLKVNQKSAENSLPAVLPTGEAAPTGWKRGAAGSPTEMQFTVDDETGANVGSASVSVVGSATASSSGGGNKTVGGVATSALRRTVIDRMIREEGWVVNDYQKEIGGKKVFVVVAQSMGAGGKMRSRLFYFTESGGRIYSVATSAPAAGSGAKRIERDTERVITALGRRKNGATQQAELK